MEISNLQRYPMLLQRVGENMIDIIHNQSVTVGDTLSGGELYGFMNDKVIGKIVESRTPKGIHKDKSAMWYRIEMADKPLFD